MSTTQPSLSKRRSWRQFGLGTLFLLVVVAAIASWCARREMLREERRAALWREMQASNAINVVWPVAPSIPWRSRVGAWLRGATPVDLAGYVFLREETSAARIGELVDLFPTIQKIEMDAVNATAENLAPWAKLNSIQSFKIIGEVKNEEALSALGRIRSVEGIYFDATGNVDDEWVRRLAAAKVDLTLIRSGELFWDVDDDGLRAMTQLPKLRDLGAGARGTDQGLAAFRGATAKTMVALKGNGYTDASAEVVASLHPISVWLEDTGHTDEGLAKMVTGPNVSGVWLKRVPVGDATLAALATAPKLTQLTLEDIDLSPEQCDEVAKLKLGGLRLVGSEWDDERVGRFAPLAPALGMFSLRAPNVTDAGLSWLQNASGLGALYLYDTRTTAKTWNQLPTLTTLNIVGLGGPHVDPSVLAATKKVTSGRILYLVGPSIDDALLASPRGSFEQMFLVETQVTLAGIRNQVPPPGARKLRLIVEYDPRESSPVTEEQSREIMAASGNTMSVECWPHAGHLP